MEDKHVHAVISAVCRKRNSKSLQRSGVVVSASDARSKDRWFKDWFLPLRFFVKTRSNEETPLDM